MTDNHEGTCLHCETGCLRCGNQHHRETSPAKSYKEVKCDDYNGVFSWKGVPVIAIPVQDIEKLLSLSVCDEVRAIAGKWLK